MSLQLDRSALAAIFTAPFASSTAFCFSLQSGASAANANVENPSVMPVKRTISVRLIVVLLFLNSIGAVEASLDRAEF